MLQLSNNGLEVSANVDELRSKFDAKHYVVLNELLGSNLLNRIHAHIEQGQWNRKAYSDGFSGAESILSDGATCNLLGFILNHPALLSTIRSITGCSLISEFSGRVYKMEGALKDSLSWHDDISESDKRQVGFSLNLSPHAFDGGIFELRNKETVKPLARVSNTGPGNALIFRISSNLEHRVTAVAGNTPKIACAGWFRSTGKTYTGKLIEQLNASHR